MTKLEEEIYNELLKHEGIDKSTDGNPLTAFLCKAHAKAAAEVAKVYIKRAFDAGESYGAMKEHHSLDDYEPNKENWLKSEGITSTE